MAIEIPLPHRTFQAVILAGVAVDSPQKSSAGRSDAPNTPRVTRKRYPTIEDLTGTLGRTDVGVRQSCTGLREQFRTQDRSSQRDFSPGFSGNAPIIFVFMQLERKTSRGQWRRMGLRTTSELRLDSRFAVGPDLVRLRPQFSKNLDDDFGASADCRRSRAPAN